MRCLNGANDIRGDYAALEEAEAAKRLEDERAELARLNGNAVAQRAWFDADAERQQRHGAEYAALKKAEQIAQEQAELAELGDDLDRLRRWFAGDAGRTKRHPERFEELQAELARQRTRKRELDQGRRDLARMEHDWDAQRGWFDDDPPRQERHPEAFDELLLAEGEREQLAERAGNLPAQREWFDADGERQQRHGAEYAALKKAEQIAQEQAELADLGDDWPELRQWFTANRGRRERHPAKYAQLRAAEEEERRHRQLLEQEQRDLARLEHDWDAQRVWFDADPPPPRTTPGSVR